MKGAWLRFVLLCATLLVTTACADIVGEFSWGTSTTHTGGHGGATASTSTSTSSTEVGGGGQGGTATSTSSTSSSTNSSTTTSSSTTTTITTDPCVPTGTGAVGVLGCPCSPSGALACNGNAHKVTLICSGGIWSLNQTCPTGQLCDSRTGVNQGTCSPVDPLCVNMSPGASMCDGATAVQCGPDLVSSTQQPCPGGFCNGAGTCGACATGTVHCNAQQPQLCDTSGQWQDSGVTCTDQTCVGGQCVGICAPTQTNCASNASYQACDSNGQWGGAPVACAQPTPDCQQGKCACLKTTCNGSCVDTASDPKNCGQCGNDCLGGGCNAGACGPAPITLVTGPTAAGAIATDGTYVFWAVYQPPTFAGVMRATVAGDSITQFHSDGGGVNAITLYGQYVFWAGGGDGQIMAQKDFKTGGSYSIVGPAQAGLGYGVSIAYDGTTAWWGCASNGGHDWGICRNQGGSTMVYGPYGGSGSAHGSLAIDGTHLYYGRQGDIRSIAKSNGAEAVLVSPASVSSASGANVQLYASNLYWVDTSGGGSILAVSTSGGATTTLASGHKQAAALAVDSTGVYWVDGDLAAGSIWMVPLAGGTPKMLASGQPWAGINGAGIAVDSTHVYWTNHTAGTVMKVAK